MVVALVTTTTMRLPELPDVPTTAEAGVPNFIVTTWYGMWGIKGTPQPIIDRLYTETAKFLQTQEAKDIWASQGADAGGQTPEQFAALIKAEAPRWAKVVRDAKIEPE